ncbi:MAG TPA: Pycsar system effector family protein [Candidatus Angelobacter sp.]
MEQGFQPVVAERFRMQIKFARYNHENQQGIIRQLDAKAAVFVTLLVFLVTAAVPLAKDVCVKLQWSGKGSISSWAYLLSSLVLISGFVATVVGVQRVIRPRGSEHPSIVQGLMFADDILGHEHPDAYHEANQRMTDEVLLKNLTTQVYQLSRIVQRKTIALQRAALPTMISFFAWALNSAFSIYILSWR